jgi:hypothetical protein
MSYKSYVLFLSQISSKPKAQIHFQDFPITIQKGTEKNRWIISTSVFVGEERLPSHVQDCVSSSGSLKWQTNGAYLKTDRETCTVSLVQEVTCTLTYIPYTQLLTDFSDLAAEWKEIFDDKGHTSII